MPLTGELETLVSVTRLMQLERYVPGEEFASTSVHPTKAVIKHKHPWFIVQGLQFSGPLVQAGLGNPSFIPWRG